MSKIFVIILGFIMVNSASAAANELHIFAPGYQMRYENDSDQTIKNRQYANYNLSAVVFDDYMIGAEFNQRSDKSGNAALNIKTEFQEFNLYAGYFIYSKLLNEEYKIVFDIGPVAYLGQNRTTVETNLGSVSDQSASQDNLSYGLGLQATLRLSALIVQAESRYAYSRSYEPGYTPVYGIRLGFRIGL
ncbi:MAG: hypothetical protein H7235_08190 [Bdellovibrionaceae bacterium]|nr:hypothetical protein [Pseudobdellovibrionaceae bacterium]